MSRLAWVARYRRETEYHLVRVSDTATESQIREVAEEQICGMTDPAHSDTHELKTTIECVTADEAKRFADQIIDIEEETT